MNAAKTIAAVVSGIVTGAGFIITSGTIHNTTVLVVIQACIVAVDLTFSALGVYITANTITTAVTAAPPGGEAATVPPAVSSEPPITPIPMLTET